LIHKKDPEALQAETINMRWLRSYTDLVVIKLRTEKFNEPQATIFLEKVKRKILARFPDREREYEMIYGRRFKRILVRKGVLLPLNLKATPPA